MADDLHENAKIFKRRNVPIGNVIECEFWLALGLNVASHSAPRQIHPQNQPNSTGLN